MFLDVRELESRSRRFDESFSEGSLSFSDEEWTPVGVIRASGIASLLDRSVSKTIRVRGRIEAAMRAPCVYCLEPWTEKLGAEFDLYYLSSAAEPESDEIELRGDDTNIGFYEGDGIELADVVREQINLWLPMTPGCPAEQRGKLPECGPDWRLQQPDEPEQWTDPRWDALRKLRDKQ